MRNQDAQDCCFRLPKKDIRTFMHLFIAIVAGTVFSACAAADQLYDFQYQFESGETLSGTIRGEVDTSNSNIVSAIFGLNAAYSGDTTPVHTDLAADVVTFSGGAPMQFVTISPTAEFTGFSLEAIGVGAERAVVEAPGGNVLENETFRRAAWSLNVRSVPEPGNACLLAACSLALIQHRRKRSA